MSENCLSHTLGRCFCSAQREAVGHAEKDWRNLTESGGGQSTRRPFVEKEASPGNKHISAQFS